MKPRHREPRGSTPSGILHDEDRRERPPTDGLLTAEEAATFLNVEVCTIRKWTHQRKVPVVKLFGRLARYRQADLETLIKKWVRPALRAGLEEGR